MTLAMIIDCRPDMEKIKAALQATVGADIDYGPPPNEAIQLPDLFESSSAW